MPPPTIPWAGYNLFRLAAVVFIAWALVAQFVALADDMKAYSAAKEDASGVKDSTVMPATGSAVSSAGIIGQVGSMTLTSSEGAIRTMSTGTLAPISTPPVNPNTIVPAMPTSAVVATSSVSTFATTPQPPVGVIGIDSESVPALVNLRRRAKRGRYVGRRNVADEVGEVQDSYYGDSAVPRQPGGPFFAAASRLLIAGALLILLFAQLGLPENTLYNYGGLLGPQSTPLALGGAQLVVAIETLRVHADQTVLIPSWCLLASTAPLYFSKMVRLLYWTRPPAFYAQIDPRDPSYPDNPHARDRHRQPPPDVEKQLPPSNALEIGLEATDDEEDVDDGRPARPKDYDGSERQVRTRPAKEDSAHTDVSQGGYPTFSGHAVNAPGRNVPAGHVDEERGDIRFVSEEAQRIRDMQEQQIRLVSRLHSQRDRQAQTVSVEQRRKERGRGKPAPLDTSFISALRRPPARANTRESTLPVSSTGSELGDSSLSRSNSKPRHRANDTLTPIGEGDEPASAMTTRSELRKSLQAAASDLGPRFPLPPGRGDGEGVDQMPLARSGSRARRESSVDSLAGDAPWASLAWGQAASAEGNTPGALHKAASAVSAQAAIHGAHGGTGSDERGHPSPESPGVTTAPERRPAARPLTMLRSSLAPDRRSPTTTEARTERVSRGVRFDLTSPKAYSPSVMTGSTATPDGMTSPRTGSRLPGTSFTIPLPFSAPSTPRTSRKDSVESTATADSAFWAARSESVASTASPGSASSVERPDMPARASSDDIDPERIRRSSDERAGLPRRDPRLVRGGRPMSMAVLGGGYLDGGDEVSHQRVQRRCFSSIDSI